jgi:hypothetical protein
MSELPYTVISHKRLLHSKLDDPRVAASADRGGNQATNSAHIRNDRRQEMMHKSSVGASKGAAVGVAFLCIAGTASADDTGAGGNACKNLPGYAALKAALVAATATESSGLNNQMWGTIVDRDGIVCAVAFTGVNRGAQWPGSRVISAQKANTANVTLPRFDVHQPTQPYGRFPYAPGSDTRWTNASADNCRNLRSNRRCPGELELGFRTEVDRRARPSTS